MIWLLLLPWLALTVHTAVNAALLRRLPDEAHEITEKVAVLLPLRNEADRVAPCLEALLAQRNIPNLTIHVLDDNSTDGTAELVRSIAGDKVNLITGAPLPHGWLGKPHACQQLAAAASDADVLSFVDADVILGPHALARATTMFREIRVTLLSPYPKITGTGRLLQPLLQWSWLTFLPLRLMERSSRPSLAAAGGQWLVIDRAGYESAGGHAAVRSEILEDIALARQIKRAGGHIALVDASHQAICRMYTSWRGLTAGYTKSLWASFGSGPAAAFVVVFLLFLYVLPAAATPILAVTGFSRASLVALGAYVLAVAGRAITAYATGARAWPDALAHPMSVLLFAGLTARSFALRRRGALTWRGRSL
jgi:hypothetical protein